MRFILTVCFFVFISLALGYAQIPNASFEQWTNGEPDEWLTTNSSPDYVPFTQSSDAHEGTSSILGTVLSFQGFAIPIALISGTQDQEGFEISTRPEALHGWYKFTSVGSDFLIITTGFEKNGSAIGAGQFTADVSTNDYTEFVINPIYINSDTPDTAYIAFQISNSTSGFPHAGSTFIVDDLSWGAATGVEDIVNLPKDYLLEQNYPNPFNPNTKISWQTPKSGYQTLKVYDVLGNEVTTLIDGDKEAGKYEINFDASQLSSGIYFYKLQTGSFIETKKMILLK